MSATHIKLLCIIAMIGCLVIALIMFMTNRSISGALYCLLSYENYLNIQRHKKKGVLVMSKYKVIAILEESINYDSLTAKVKNVTSNKLFEGYVFDLLDEIEREVSSEHELYIIDIVDNNKRSLINSVVNT